MTRALAKVLPGGQRKASATGAAPPSKVSLLDRKPRALKRPGATVLLAYPSGAVIRRSGTGIAKKNVERRDDIAAVAPTEPRDLAQPRVENNVVPFSRDLVVYGAKDTRGRYYKAVPEWIKGLYGAGNAAGQSGQGHGAAEKDETSLPSASGLVAKYEKLLSNEKEKYGVGSATRAYRKLANRFHPDKTHSLKLKPAEQKAAEDEFKAVSSAWSNLKKRWTKEKEGLGKAAGPVEAARATGTYDE
jgi:hypothetical protein